MRAKILTQVIFSLLLIGAMSAQALEPLGSPVYPYGTRSFATVWQEMLVAENDVYHWLYAAEVAKREGLLTPNANNAQQVWAITGVMRMIILSPLNKNAKWGKDSRGYPTFIAGKKYYLPTLSPLQAGAIAPAVMEEAKQYFAAQRQQMNGSAKKVSQELTQDIPQYDPKVLQSAGVTPNDLADQLDGKMAPFISDDEDPDPFADTRAFVALLRDGDLDKVAAFQKSIQSMIDKAVAKEATDRMAADGELAKQIGEVVKVNGEIAEQNGDLAEKLATFNNRFTALENSVKESVRALATQNSTIVADMERTDASVTDIARKIDTTTKRVNSVAEEVEKQKNAVEIAVNGSNSADNEMKKEIADMEMNIWAPFVLAIILFLGVLGLDWNKNRPVRKKVNDPETGLDATHQLVLETKVPKKKNAVADEVRVDGKDSDFSSMD